MTYFVKLLLIPAAVLTVTGCMSMPDFGGRDIPPEFAEQIRNADTYPDVADAPARPGRPVPASVFDAKARQLMTEKGTFDGIDAPLNDISSQILREIEVLSAQVNAYKADDPQ